MHYYGWQTQVYWRFRNFKSIYRKHHSRFKNELEFELAKLNDDWHFSSLEKIFIEKRIYRNIEDCETWEAVIETIDKGLKPYKKLLRREITTDDIIALTEIKIKRISKFDSFKADEHIKSVSEKMAAIEQNLANIKAFAIDWFKDLIKKYGKGKERKTSITDGFEIIEAKRVVMNNAKLYVNRTEGFAGTALKKDEYICDCSDMDDIIVFTRDGKCTVSRIDDKKYFGKDILHIAVFNKDDADTVYNMLYQDGKNGALMVKRFLIAGVTRDKPYDLTKGTENSKVWYFSIGMTQTQEVIQINLKPKPKLRNLIITLPLNDQLVKGRNAIGNIVTKFSFNKIQLYKETSKTNTVAKPTISQVIETKTTPASNEPKTQGSLDFKDLLS